MKTQKYYDARAAAYDEERSKGWITKWVCKEEHAVKRLLNVHQGECVLDVGCGQGRYTHMVHKQGATVYGIDISPNMIQEYLKRGFRGRVVDIAAEPVTETFDKIVCSGALEFTSDPAQVLKNISASLKKNSVFVLLYPRFTVMGMAYKMYHFKNGLNIHLFSDRKIKRMFSNNGMKILALEKPHSFAGVLKAKRI